MDFTALFHCDHSTAAGARALAALESADRPKPLQHVSLCWQQDGFAALDEWGANPAWVRPEDAKIALPGRPPLPCLDIALRLPEGFFLTVASDTVVVYHLLRWQIFLTEPAWQAVMFEALRWLYAAFAATDCVLAHDCHSTVLGIRRGLSFLEALAAAEREGVGEVPAFKDLYLEVESESDTAMKPVQGHVARIVRWPRDKPLPAGWSRPTVWDSTGYWRYAPP